MIVEQRDYHVYTGKLNEVVALYESEGIALQPGTSASCSARSRRTSARCSTYTHLWGYESYAEREQRRAALQADPEWKDFLGRGSSRCSTPSRTASSIPTSFSPIR